MVQGWRHPNFSWSLTRMSLSSRVVVAPQSLVDPTSDEFLWYPKPVGDLKSCLGDINVVTSVLPFCETSDVSAQKAILEAMTPIAEKFFAEAQAQGEDSPRMAFLILTKTGLGKVPVRSCRETAEHQFVDRL